MCAKNNLASPLSSNPRLNRSPSCMQCHWQSYKYRSDAGTQSAADLGRRRPVSGTVQVSRNSRRRPRPRQAWWPPPEHGRPCRLGLCSLLHLLCEYGGLQVSRQALGWASAALGSPLAHTTLALPNCAVCCKGRGRPPGASKRDRRICRCRCEPPQVAAHSQRVCPQRCSRGNTWLGRSPALPCLV